MSATFRDNLLRWFSKPVAAQPPADKARRGAELLAIGRSDPARALKALRSRSEGLSQAQARGRLRTHGLNEVVHEKPVKWYIKLLKAFWTPFSLLLTSISIVSYFTDDVATGTIVAAMVVISVVLAFVQEYRSSKAAERLKAMVTNTATVLRRKEVRWKNETEEDADRPAADGADGAETAPAAIQLPDRTVVSERLEIPIKRLVPGDIIQLSAGDMIPADVRVLTAKDLFVAQAALTGEAMPVEKSAQFTATGDAPNPLEMGTLCFMGSNVVSGTATVVVVHTGDKTFLGGLAESLVGQRVVTSFEKGVGHFTRLMLYFMAVMVPLVFFINGFVKHSWQDAMLFAISVAVGLTPEMLPMIVTVNLAKGALSMSRNKVIVKRLNSIQNFGAMDVLCTDKTGTLTQNKVVLLKYVDASGFKNDKVLKYAYLNSFYQTGLKNLLDVAVLSHVEISTAIKPETNYRKIDEIPFDFVRRRMSVVVEEEGKRDVLICKGALEEIFNVSTNVEMDGTVEAIDEELKEDLKRITQDLNEDGLRVIAVAYKEIPTDHPEYTVKDEGGMTLLGYLAFLDPPKETTHQALNLLQAHNVTVKVLTGDNEVVSRKICTQVGLDAEHILLGGQIEAMNDNQLADAVEQHQVFAKLSPAQKERIVKALHLKGHVVGFLGDGINDAPALRAADVGISVDNAVDIAKESADIILLEKNLLVLEQGVVEGRMVFGNIVKYIKMGASSNFGNMFSVLGASILLPFFPMLPVQILVQNLLYDFSQVAIPLDRVDEEYLAQPRKWEIGDIARYMIFIGPISSIFDYTTFGLMWFYFGANSVAHQSLFQSAWFVEGLLSQTLIVHMIRTNKIPFIQSRASWPLLATTASIMLVGIYIPFSPLAGKLKMMPLPWHYFPWLAATLLGYALLTQIVKTWFVRRYGVR
jgi:Mg2+-importing ATPase